MNEKTKDRLYWAVGVALTIAFCVVVGGTEVQAAERPKPTIDYASRSLDKTIVVGRTGTKTISAPRGSGMRVITEVREPRVTKSYRRDRGDRRR